MTMNNMHSHIRRHFSIELGTIPTHIFRIINKRQDFNTRLSIAKIFLSWLSLECSQFAPLTLGLFINLLLFIISIYTAEPPKHFYIMLLHLQILYTSLSLLLCTSSPFEGMLSTTTPTCWSPYVLCCQQGSLHFVVVLKYSTDTYFKTAVRTY